MITTLWILLAAQASAGETPGIPAGVQLEAVVRDRDSELFATIFERCDPAGLRAMVSDDFEMYHDKAGVVARSGDAFVAQYARDCAARKAPDAWRTRRELVAASLTVDPVPGHGAIQHGEHLFYERQGAGPERLAGRAVFTQLWTLTPEGWRLSRVFSFRHRAAGGP